MVQHRTERKRSAVRRATAGELAFSSEAQFPLGGERVVATESVRSSALLTRGDLSASAPGR